jgi:hypothetical protein
MVKHCVYTTQHIRPLAVRPPFYPGSVPTPWGFLISGLQSQGAK